MANLGSTGVVVVVQLLSRVPLFVTAWTVARQASLAFTISWPLPKLIGHKPKYERESESVRCSVMSDSL